MNLGLASKFTQFTYSYIAYYNVYHQTDLLTNFYGKIPTGKYWNRKFSKIGKSLCHNEFEHALI